MTHFSGPFNIMQDSNADTTTVSIGTSGQVLVGGTFNSSGAAVLHSTLQVDGATQLVGTVSAAGHSFAASAVSLEVPTTVAGSALAGSSVVTAAAWFQTTINGTLYYIPAFTSA